MSKLPDLNPPNITTAFIWANEETSPTWRGHWGIRLNEGIPSFPAFARCALKRCSIWLPMSSLHWNCLVKKSKKARKLFRKSSVPILDCVHNSHEKSEIRFLVVRLALCSGFVKSTVYYCTILQDARFFFEAIDLPELTKIIPAKKLRLRVPIFSASDLIKPETPPTSPVNTPSKRFVSDRFTVTDKVESRTKAPAAVNLSTSPLFVSTSKIEFISPGNVLSKCDKALLQSLYSVYFKNRLIL